MDTGGINEIVGLLTAGFLLVVLVWVGCLLIVSYGG